MPRSGQERDGDTRRSRILRAVTAQGEFSTGVVKEACPGEAPAFVTRVIHELEREGWLRRRGPKARPSFEWTCAPESFDIAAWAEGRRRSPPVKRTPVDDRPRERLLAEGPRALKTAELLAILVRSGRPGESAMVAGEKLAARFAERLERLADAGRGELHEVSPAVGTAAYCQVMAGIELGRRVAAAAQAAGQAVVRIRGAADAMTYCAQRFRRLAEEEDREHFHVVTLNTRYEVIGCHTVSTGSLDASIVHPREVFRPAIRDAAKAVILVHNHPSGDPGPSRQDVAVTRRLEKAGETIGIEVLDHIVVARRGVASLRRHMQKTES